MPEILPESLQSFTEITWQIREVSRSGGPSVLGTEQIIQSPAGRWTARVSILLTAQDWHDAPEILAYKALMTRLHGRAGLIDLPYLDGQTPAGLRSQDLTAPFSDNSTFSDGSSFFTAGLSMQAPFSDGASFSDQTVFSQPATIFQIAEAAEMNDVEIVVDSTDAIWPESGQCFTTPDGRLHSIGKTKRIAPNRWRLSISPWLRADYPAGALLNFDEPTSLMRLVSDDAGALSQQAGQPFSTPSVEFVEY